MKLYIKISLLILIVWPKSFFGQTYFNMLYPPEQGTWGGGTMAIISLNTNFFFDRWSVNNINGNFESHFTRVGKLGDIVQITDSISYLNKSIGSGGINITKTGTFVSAVYIQNYNPNSQQYGIIKHDSTGKRIFLNINSSKYSYVYTKQVLALSNDQIISIGDIQPIQGNPLEKVYILLAKSDSLGNELWKKTYNTGNYIEQAESVALCNDGGFIIGGAELIINGPDKFYSPIVIKTDSNGNVEWKKKYGSTQYSNWPAYGITQTQDGGFAFCGGVGITDSSNTDEQLPWVVKLNSNGNIVWADTNSGDNLTSIHVTTYFKDIIELTDGSIVVCGQQLVWYNNKPAPDKYRWRGVIKKLSASGTPIWTRYYSHPEIVDLSGAVHFLYDIDPTPDGGFVAAGWASYTADGTQSTWVIKVDSFGCLVPGCEVNSVPKIEPLIAKLKVYPNPTNGVLNIDITPSSLRLGSVNQNEFVFELYDILGKRVFVKNLQPFENNIDVSNLPTGVYTYKIGSIWGQIIKQ